MAAKIVPGGSRAVFPIGFRTIVSVETRGVRGPSTGAASPTKSRHPMLELPRIPVERQRNVGRALTDALAHKRKPALDADVARLGHTVLTATDALAAGTGPDAPITPAVAGEVAALPSTFHGDPADRLIVATARVMGATLLTVDGRIVDAKLVPTLS